MRTRRFIIIGVVVVLLVLGIFLLRSPGILSPETAERQQSLIDLMFPDQADADLFSDGDMPPFAEGLIDEGTYLLLREEQLAALHGVPTQFGRNLRAEAIEELDRQTALLGNTLLSNVWVPIGPAPVPNGRTTTIQTPVSGRTTSIAIHPTNPDIAYVGTAQGGLYRTLDGGQSWTPLMDNALSLAVGSVAISPSDPTIVYVGTGEAHSSCDSFFGVGVYIITNADSNSPTLNGPFNQDGSGTDVLSNRAIGRVLVSPTNPNTIFVGTYAGIGGIGCEVPASAPSAGVYRSTNALSGSPTFTKLNVATDNFGNNRVTDMIFEPGNPDTMLVGVRASSGVSGGGIYRTTNALASNPIFSKVLDINVARIEFAINKIGSTVTVLAATEENSGKLRRSTDGGLTWPDTITGPAGWCGGQCWYNIGIAMDPNDANIIYLGGQGNSGAARILIKSTDGMNFSMIDTGLHPDTHDIRLAPSNPSIVYVASDGGIWRSEDAGGSFTSLNNTDFSATQFQSLALHPTDPNFMIGGTQDNGTECLGACGSNTDTNAWIRADLSDGGTALIDQNAVNTSAVTMYHTYYNFQGAMGYVKVTNTQDAYENNWTLYGCGFAGAIPNGFDCTDPVNFYAPMTLGPGSPNTLYFGSDVLYRSADGGQSMAVVSQDPVDPLAGLEGRLSTIAVSPQNDNVRIVGLRNGKVFATTTGSSSLTDVTPPSAPGQYVGRVAIDPNNSSTAYITYAGFGAASGAHIWKTTNLAGGAGSWVPSGTGVPDVPVNAFVVDPNNSDHLYAGTDIGVYRSTDGGASWTPFSNQLPRVAVFDMAIQNSARILRVATHGKGIWEIGLDNVVPDIDQFSKRVTASGPLEPGVTLTYTLRLTNTGGTAGTAVVHDTFPASMETAVCTGAGGAAFLYRTGDLNDTVSVLGTNGTATYFCAAQVESPVLAVDTIPSTTNTPPGSSITYTIKVENLSGGALQNVTVSDTFIPLGNCNVNPSIPFNMLPGQVITFVCPNVVVNNPVTNTTTATGSLPITNTATVMGTSAVLQDTAETLIIAQVSDQTTVTAGDYKIYFPAIPINFPE
ncbi:MAG: hypothetical protein WAM60_25140 [Candidatus Promineifilaceae bacterium]